MTFALVSASLNHTNFTTAASPTCAYATDVGAHSLLVACIYFDNGSNAVGTISSVTDTLGNTWATATTTQTVAQASASFHGGLAMYQCTSSKGTGPNTVTVNLSAGQVRGDIHVHEYITTNQAGATEHVQGTISNTTANGTTQAVATSLSATTGDLVVGCYALNDVTASNLIGNSSSYVNDIQQNAASLHMTSSHLLAASSTAVQTCTFTWTAYKGSIGVISAYTEAAAATVMPKNPPVVNQALKTASNW